MLIFILLDPMAGKDKKGKKKRKKKTFSSPPPFLLLFSPFTCFLSFPLFWSRRVWSLRIVPHFHFFFFYCDPFQSALSLLKLIFPLTTTMTTMNIDYFDDAKSYMDETKRDGMGWNGTGMEWNGMGWDGHGRRRTDI